MENLEIKLSLNRSLLCCVCVVFHCLPACHHWKAAALPSCLLTSTQAMDPWILLLPARWENYSETDEMTVVFSTYFRHICLLHTALISLHLLRTATFKADNPFFSFCWSEKPYVWWSIAPLVDTNDNFCQLVSAVIWNLLPHTRGKQWSIKPVSDGGRVLC